MRVKTKNWTVFFFLFNFKILNRRINEAIEKFKTINVVVDKEDDRLSMYLVRFCAMHYCLVELKNLFCFWKSVGCSVFASIMFWSINGSIWVRIIDIIRILIDDDANDDDDEKILHSKSCRWNVHTMFCYCQGSWTLCWIVRNICFTWAINSCALQGVRSFFH